MKVLRYNKKLEPKQFIVTIVTIIAVAIMLGDNQYSNSYICLFTAIALFLSFFLIDSRSAYAMVSSKEFLFLALFLLYAFIMGFSKYGLQTSLGGVGNYFLYYFGFTVFLFFLHKNTPRTLNWVIAIILGLYLFQAARLMVLYLEHPGIARLIISGKADRTLSARFGNPYGIAQGISFISIALLDISLTVRKRPFIMLLMIIMMVFFTVVVVMTQSAITLLVLVICYFLCFVSRLSTRKKSGVMVLFFLLILLVLFRGTIGSAFIHYADTSSVVGIRMLELGDFLVSGTRSNDITARFGLFGQSFQSFLEHPILGNRYTVGNMSGNHAEIIDIFSDFGLLGGVPLLLVFVLYFKHVLKNMKRRPLLLWLPALFTSFLNPIVGVQAYLAMLFVVPSLYFLAIPPDNVTAENDLHILEEP